MNIIEKMSFTVNQKIAGKCWLDNNFPNVEELDIAYLTVRFDMPGYAAAYIRDNWFENASVKKPFSTSELYSKSESSSSSLYTE